ncbi:MAG: GGDEF-domain containing protein [Burkholderiales bacterium PBB4]|nr:MAG: GGDEF-domain containing protein [Burkholderiales bacterium PBB4]
MSLRSRILWLILLASLLPLLPVLWGLNANRIDTIARAQTQLSNRTEGIAAELDSRISGTTQLLFGLSRVPLLATADKPTCSAFLANVLKEHPQYTGLLTILPNGQLHCDSLKTGRALNLTDRAYFQRALQSTQYVVEPTIGRLTGKGVLQIALPVRSASGALLYVLLASLNLDDFGKQMAATLPYQGMNLQIWNDNASFVLDHPGPGAMPLQPNGPEKDAVLAAASGALYTLGEGAATRIWTTAALPRTRSAGLRLTLTMPRAVLLEREDWQFKRALGALLALSVVFLVVAALLGEFAVRRQVSRLVKAINRLDQGNFKERIGAPYPTGELGGMMLALDRMAGSLEQQHQTLERNAETLQLQANTDALTGLANRNLLNDRLHQAIIYAHRSERVVGVLLLDLDRFKTVNDSLGHSQGDVLLKTVAQRLQACSREGDTVARLGGDEFVLVLSDMAQVSDLLPIVQEILQALSRPIELQGQLVNVSASLGLSAYPRDGDSADELIRHADTAMYRAKERGRNAAAFFTPEMDHLLVERLRMEAGLRRALEQQEFRVVFQPIVHAATGKVASAEALLRWQDPERGLVPPVQFISIAEETGLIIPIGNWVLQQACLQAKAWQDQGLGSIPVAVNLSARQFNAPSLGDAIATALAQAQCPPALLQLEITESMVINDAEQALQTMHRIVAMGVHLSIDDFGTGYSSLSYLKRFPVRKLKIDRSFVNELETDAHDRAIVDAILTLAHKLGLRAVAEGVETAGQLALLQQLGCDECQGYYFAKPCTAEAFAALPLAWV